MTDKKNLRFLLAALLCLCAPLPQAAAAQAATPSGGNSSQNTPGKASVRVVEREMLTYPYSAPREEPDFGRIYPYHRFDGYAPRGEMQRWEMVEMENDYIRLWVMPSVGGKVWGAIDKRSGREFVYFNHVVKFRDVGLRGPWTSGGIEMNFGTIGHSPWCAEQVDYTTSENPDGSVSCTVGGTDLALGTDWRVSVTLPADRACFETEVLWFNGSGWDRPAYQWMNAGIKTSGNLEYAFPGDRYLEHDGTSRSWPADSLGHRISWYEKNDFGHYKSYHVAGQYSNFWGGYWHNDDFGFGHSAEYGDKPGKKVWIWGLSPYGMIWEKLLTDTDGQYSEVQSGRLLNQSIGTSYRTPFKHSSLSPYVTNSWTERWFPVQGTGGIRSATEELAFNIVAEEGGATLKLYAIAPARGQLRLESEGAVLVDAPIDLTPTQTLSLPLKAAQAGEAVPAKIDLLLDGRRIFSSAIHETSLTRPQRLPAGFDHGSVYGLYLLGREFERQYFLPVAAEKYRAALAKDPNYQPALVRLAGILFQQQRTAEARELCARALAIDTYDGAANCLWGMIATAEGRTADALEGFALATQSTEYREAACTELALIWLREGDYAKARHYGARALEYNARNLTALQLQTLLERIDPTAATAATSTAAATATAAEPAATSTVAATTTTVATTKNPNTSENSPAGAATGLDLLMRADPLNHFAAWERYLKTGNAADKSRFAAGIRNAYWFESYLHIADFYYRTGRYADALAVLEAAPEHPKIACWQAWLHTQSGNRAEAERLLAQIATMNPSLVFPFRPAEQQLFGWLAGALPSWQGNYYLALCKMQNDSPAAALELLNRPQGTAPVDFYPYYVLRASLQSDPALREADLLEALRIAPQHPRTTQLVAQLYMDRGEWAKAQGYLEKQLAKEPSDYTAGMKLARTLAEQGQFAASLALMRRLEVLPNEGAQEGRYLWRETNLHYACALMERKQPKKALEAIASSRLWPENMGVAKPYDNMVDERLEDFLEWIALGEPQSTAKKGGNDPAARIVAHIATPGYKAHCAADLLSALMLRRAGQTAEADALMAEWLAAEPDKKSSRWCDAVYRGNWAGADRIALEPGDRLNPLPYEILFDDRDFGMMLRHRELLEPLSGR